MIEFHYRKESSKIAGQVIRPVADVALQSNQHKVEVIMYIDSGADITVIPLEIGKILGFNQQPTDQIREIKGVAGGGVPYILKKAKIILNGRSLKIRLAWALIEEIPLLLGRMDIFPKFKIIFDEKQGLITFV